MILLQGHLQIHVYFLLHLLHCLTSISSLKDSYQSKDRHWPLRYSSCQNSAICTTCAISNPFQFNPNMSPINFEPTVNTEKAAFGLQCFWHSEAYLASAPGVIRTRVGYAGGSLKNPQYRNLGDHIETIEVDFDPTRISFEDLLARFWDAHDPTVKHKRQYISAIFYYNDIQKKLAEQSMINEQKKKDQKIVTEILPIGEFYNAEDYHQKYLLRQEKELFSTLQLSDPEVISSHVAAKLNGYAAGYGTMDQYFDQSKHWGLSHHQIELAKKMITEKDGKPEGCGI